MDPFLVQYLFLRLFFILKSGQGRYPPCPPGVSLYHLILRDKYREGVGSF